MDYISSNFPVFGLPIQQFCMSRISQFLVHIFSSFACLGVKKKKILERTQVLKTRVPSGENFSPDALFRPRAYKNRASREKKFPQWISRLRVSRSTREIFWPQMLCLGRERVSRFTEEIFFPRCSV